MTPRQIKAHAGEGVTEAISLDINHVGKIYWQLRGGIAVDARVNAIQATQIKSAERKLKFSNNHQAPQIKKRIIDTLTLASV
ncbi:hypothetical protein DK843_19225 [Chromobacterium phragmitis]|uniref:Uncharacterized protein n=1 Tax=Chromobacterium phragmitis TaxID=2202141 RepID=A0A344ULU0_9NEIS|nr:hypothetical protein DK843_19225 [Chromobacterium phragmitis]